MNFLSGRWAEELTVYGWNTKVSAPFIFRIDDKINSCISLKLLYVFLLIALDKVITTTFCNQKQRQIQPFFISFEFIYNILTWS